MYRCAVGSCRCSQAVWVVEEPSRPGPARPGRRLRQPQPSSKLPRGSLHSQEADCPGCRSSHWSCPHCQEADRPDTARTARSPSSQPAARPALAAKRPDTPTSASHTRQPKDCRSAQKGEDCRVAIARQRTSRIDKSDKDQCTTNSARLL